MKKLLRGLGGMALALVLVGAGCNTNFGGADNSPTPTDASSSLPDLNLGVSSTSDVTKPEMKKGEENKENKAMEKKEGAMMSDLDKATLTLSAEALGDRQVKFTWETDAKLSDANRFIVVRSDKENPVHSGANQWSRFAYSVREATLANQSLGSFHYRVCITANNNPDTCAKYSDDVVMDVK